MTYLPAEVAGRWFYLYLILDVYSRKIVGFDRRFRSPRSRRRRPRGASSQTHGAGRGYSRLGGQARAAW
ncbi:protein of unknown function (plasmid) [Cupriavidus taiwanensis]|uniref:Integrase catalytic domain-containing protein n=1 Tax=Cupriavidus taiwanensis TaxID=164546 RepID=A0A375IT29_9BURK|nr:protein of unknown function [Cupriavidus taiwanensis]